MSIERSNFGELPDGTRVDRYTLKNTGGMTAEFLTYGCRIAKLCVPDRNGKSENVVLGHDTLAEYEKPNDVMGAVVGRFANRIAGGEFEIGKKTYHLVKNENGNSLHSAPGGFQDKVWQLRDSVGDDEAPSVTFAYHSPAGECGFPGNADVEVTYTLSTDNALIIEYYATADAETPLNLTNHSYFNITGNAGEDILSVRMQINADSTTETDKNLIPTGKLLPVVGTPFDFRAPKTIGRDICAKEASLKNCGGYDHNFVLSGGSGMKKAAELFDPVSGRKMLVFTDLPGMQVYTANGFAEGTLGNGGVSLPAHHAVCLETQFFPDSVHRPEFPYKNLKPGKLFRTKTIYKFTLE